LGFISFSPTYDESFCMKISLVVAASENNVIGRGQHFALALPADLKYFKAITWQAHRHGPKTWDSIGKPLPGRMNI